MMTRLHVENLTGNDITHFLTTCSDADYQRWWPGTHLELHTVKGNPGSVGSLVYMDEYIGERRIQMTGRIMELVSGRRLVMQVKRRVMLPVWLKLTLKDDETGVLITHSIEAGYKGLGSLLDPIFRLLFSKAYAEALDDHVRKEFPMLRNLISENKRELHAQT